jgi:DNA-binding MarR family transcriptional regulator
MSRLQKVSELSRGDSSLQPDHLTPLLDQLTRMKRSLRHSQVSHEAEQLHHPSVVQSARTGTKAVLHMMIRARAERFEFLPADLFADPAWDMLLDLYLADIMSERVSVSSLCGASNVPMSTALRWIAALAREGLTVRTADRRDGRRFFVALSETGLARMDAYFTSLSTTHTGASVRGC